MWYVIRATNKKINTAKVMLYFVSLMMSGCILSASITDLNAPVVKPSGLHFIFIGASSIQAGNCSSYTVTLLDAQGALTANNLSDEQVNLVSSSVGNFYSDSLCSSSPISSTIVPKGSSSVIVYFRSLIVGSPTLSIQPSHATFGSETSSVSVVHGPAAQMVFSRQPNDPTAAGSEIPVKVTIQDAYGNIVNDGVDSTTTVTLSLTGGTGPLAGTLVVSAVGGVADFTFLGANISNLGAGKIITATKANTTGSGGTSALTVASNAFQVISNTSWFGASGVAVWMATGGSPSSGRADGMFDTPLASYVDASGNLYVADSGNTRVQKFNSTGTYLGWIGTVRIPPTGGAAGCTSLIDGSATPGWCTGGSSGNGTVHGITGDGTYIYVTQGSAIVRYNAASGAQMGWIGRVGTTPSGGLVADLYTAGCSTTPSGTVTPGWCVNGSSSSGNDEGSISNGMGITTDGTYLYVVDSGNSKIQRYVMASGAAAGWIGQNATANCGGVGVFTTGWCTTAGASSSASWNGDGSLALNNRYAGIYYDSGSNTLFVANTTPAGINKYSTAGAFLGWTGSVYTTPTGGPGACTSLTYNLITPDWCTGGAANGNNTSPTAGQLSAPAGITGDGTYLYVTHYFQVAKYLMSNGQFVGWIGRIKSGACAGGVGNFTSGWCSVAGSQAETGNGDGMLGYSYLGSTSASEIIAYGGIFYSAPYLYVNDAANHRVSLYTATTGAFNGWIGASATPNVNWVTSGIPVGNSFDEGAFSYFGRSGIFTDGTNLFVTDNSRIKKFDITSSTSPNYLGWIGRVLYTPTGGAAGCTALVDGSITPGWCTGGKAKIANNGMALDSLSASSYTSNGLFFDGAYLYATDGLKGLIAKIDAGVGSLLSWIGGIYASPTGGDAGCAGAAYGTFTPGWCTGGAAYETGSSGPNSGQMSRPGGVYSDGTYIYVANNYGWVSRYVAATGQYTGWIGYIATSPTGGAPGCAGATGLTPGWCLGGTVDWTNNNLNSITGDGTYIYISYLFKGSVSRFVAATGAFAGWIGSISSPPTSGEPGCAGATGITPGWCYGGSPAVGLMYSPNGMHTDGSYLYVVDGAGHRVIKFVQSTGALVGWKGKIKTVPTGPNAACTGAAVGSYTPDWCTGGSSSTGFDNGMMLYPQHITGAGSFLYVNDGNYRILRIGK